MVWLEYLVIIEHLKKKKIIKIDTFHFRYLFKYYIENKNLNFLKKSYF